MGPTVVQHHGHVAGGECLPPFVEKWLKAGTLAPGEKQAEAGPRRRFHRRIQPEPFLLVVVDPGRACPSGGTSAADTTPGARSGPHPAPTRVARVAGREASRSDFLKAACATRFARRWRRRPVLSVVLWRMHSCESPCDGDHGCPTAHAGSAARL